MDAVTATWALVVVTAMLVLVTVPSAFVAWHQAREARAAGREARAAQAEAEIAAEAARAAVEAAQTAGEVRIYAVEESGSPAWHHVIFNDGNTQPALDPHDRRSLRAARHSDPVVISDDPTLGQTVALGLGEVSAMTFGWACAVLTVGCALALGTDMVHNGSSRFLLVVVALTAAVPAVRILPSRLLHRDGAVAIGSAGVTVHRRGKELHLAWIEIRRVGVTTTSRRRPQAQIRLTPATPGGFDSHKGSGLLRIVSRAADPTEVTNLVTYSHAIPLRGRRRIQEGTVLITFVDATLERFAGKKHASILPDQDLP